MNKFKDNLVWFLEDVSNAEDYQIEDSEIEIIGETENGMECSTTVDIRELCGEASKEINYLQSQIDSLMLEYCPKEMTKEQIQNWEDHQQKVIV